MNILFVSDNIFNPILGGIERVTDILAKELRKTGHHIFYLCDVIHDNSLTDYQFPADLMVLPEEGSYDNINNISFYRSIIKDLSIDIVVNQRGWAPYFNNAIDGEVAVINVVHTTPNGLVQYNMNRLLNHERTIYGRMKYFCKVLLYPIYMSTKGLQFFLGLYRHYLFLSTKSNAIIFLSEKYVQSFNRFFSFGSSKCYIGSIPNPTPRHTGPNQYAKEKIVLFVGRLTWSEKRPDRLVRIWERIFEHNPEWTLIFVGDGEERLRLEQYVLRKRLRQIKFVGAVKDVSVYYRKASCICLTSNFEGWGMCLIEGMSYGCVPIAFNSFKSASDIIDDRVNGALVRPFSIKEYAKRLDEIMNNQNLREEFAVRSITKAKSFTPESVVEKWEQLFSMVIKGPIEASEETF